MDNTDEIDAVALVMLIENNFQEFEEYAGGEDEADKTLAALKRQAGMN